MQSRMLEDVSEVTEQVEKQIERLVDLREKRDSNPGESALSPGQFQSDFDGPPSIFRPVLLVGRSRVRDGQRRTPT